MSNLINVNDEICTEQAFNRTADERRALKPQEVSQSKLDIASVVACVLGAWPKIQALREEMAKLPDLDLPAIDKLEQRTYALIHAQTNYLTVSESPDALRELVEELVRTRAVLHADTQALGARGLINPDSLDDYNGGTGHKVVATDVQILAAVLKRDWSKNEGKCAVEKAELDRAEKVASRILRLVGLKMQADSAEDPALDERNRAYTLVERSYDEATRASCYLRWFQGDAEELVPSLYATRKPRSTGREEPAAPPAEPTPVNPTPVNRNLDHLPGGSPFLD